MLNVEYIAVIGLICKVGVKTGAKVLLLLIHVPHYQIKLILYLTQPLQSCLIRRSLQLRKQILFGLILVTITEFLQQFIQ